MSTLQPHPLPPRDLHPLPARVPARVAARVAGRLADRRLLAALLVAWLPLAALLFATDGRFSIAAVTERCDTAPPDVRPYTSPAEVRDFVRACGDAGLAAYRDLQLVDLVYPATFGLLLATALALLLRAGRPDASRWAGLAVLPLLAATFDYAENVAAWALLARAPDPAPWAERLQGVASASKQVTTWAAAVLLLACLARAGVALVRRTAARRSLSSGHGSL